MPDSSHRSAALGFETVIARSPDHVAELVAERLEGLIAAATTRPVTVALSGGSTPKRLYERLAAAPFRERVHWDRVELFFGDERSVPPDDPDSNYRMADEALLSQVPVTAHRMRAEIGDAAGYERVLRERIPRRRGEWPAFDIVLLGMGPDGHTASLFPGTAALDERVRQVVMNDVPQLGTQRMTLTYPVLNAAQHVWVLVPGADKRDIVARCLEARERPGGATQYPVVGVRPTDGELVWWLDEGSAPS
jgi:6-phosphogluconolactonase